MSDRPRKNTLDEIMDRDPAYRPGPAEPPTGEVPADGPSAPEETAPADERRSKPSSVYLYLVVLFGAAFLMLLLAYFVQRRNHAIVQDDLRMITASKEELVEEIESLQQQLADTQEQLEKVERDLLVSEDVLERTQTSCTEAWNIVNAFDSLYTLQQLYEAGDIEGAKTFLDVSKVEETDGMDQVETGLSGILSPSANLPLEAFPPVVQWRELKAAVLGAEIEE